MVAVGEGGVGAEWQHEQSFCLSDSEWLWSGIDFQKVQPVGVIKSPAIVCLGCASESGVEEVAALARRYVQQAAASRSVLGATVTGLSLQRDKKVVYPFVSPIKNVSWWSFVFMTVYRLDRFILCTVHCKDGCNLFGRLLQLWLWTVIMLCFWVWLAGFCETKMNNSEYPFFFKSLTLIQNPRPTKWNSQFWLFFFPAACTHFSIFLAMLYPRIEFPNPLLCTNLSSSIPAQCQTLLTFLYLNWSNIIG